MKPYYSDDYATILHGDCRAVLPHVDAAVLLSDPPYGLQNVAGSYGRHGDTIQNDMDTSVRDEVLEVWGDRPLLIFSTPRLPEPPGHWDHRLIWDKVEPGLNGGPWRLTHENIFVRGDGWVRVSAGSFSVFRYPTRNGAVDRGLHPHRKPTDLLMALMQAAPPGTVLDPFMGSGTTLVAAKNLGRKSIGIEIEEKYCQIAAERLSQCTLNLEEISSQRLSQGVLGLGGVA